MGLIDVFLLILLVGFVYFGLFFGFIHTLGNLLGSIVGIFIAARITEPLFDSIGFLLGGGAMARVIIFAAIFLLIAKLFGMAFWFVDKTMRILHIIPFVKSINKLLGGILGFVEGVIIIGIILYYAHEFGPELMQTAIENSIVSTNLMNIVKVLTILFPVSLRMS